MNANPSASNWAAERGEKWLANLRALEAMFAALDEPLLDALHLDGPTRIADLACGGGGTSFNILRRAPRGSVVHGFDISKALIGQARGRAKPFEHAPSFDVADIATAAPKAPYGRLLSRLGIMFFEEPQAAFANLTRWLEPGGHFVFAVWGTLAENSWMSSVKEAVARVTEVPQAVPDAPGAFRYAEAGPLLALLGRAGFDNLDVRDWRGQLPMGGALEPAAAAQFALEAFSSFGELLTKAGDAAFKQARQALEARFSQHWADGAVRMEACVHMVTGARP